MEKADAFLYLNLREGEDIEDAYEEHIFQFKQFFLSNVLTSKTFNAKRNRLVKIHDAYIYLCRKEEASSCEKLDLVPYDSDQIAQTFRTFQENNNQIKLKVASCTNAKCLIEYSGLLIKNISDYAKKWNVNLEGGEEKILITKEPDPIELLNAINDFNNRGYIYFDEIEKLDPSNAVYRESIRLSLWLKMENNE